MLWTDSNDPLHGFYSIAPKICLHSNDGNVNAEFCDRYSTTWPHVEPKHFFLSRNLYEVTIISKMQKMIRCSDSGMGNNTLNIIAMVEMHTYFGDSAATEHTLYLREQFFHVVSGECVSAMQDSLTMANALCVAMLSIFTSQHSLIHFFFFLSLYIYISCSRMHFALYKLLCC